MHSWHVFALMNIGSNPTEVFTLLGAVDVSELRKIRGSMDFFEMSGQEVSLCTCLDNAPSLRLFLKFSATMVSTLL